MHEFYRNKNILITGHTGFKGTWLGWLLSSLGAHVFGYALPPQQDCLYQRAKPPLSDECLADIRDGTTLKQAVSNFAPDLVFHLAAHSYINGSHEFPKEIFDINIMGTVCLLEAIRTSGRTIPTVVVTSDKCYTRQMNGMLCREDDPFGAAEAYSTSKACQDLVAQSYQVSFPEMRVAVARASNAVGGGDFNCARLIPYLLNCFAKGETAKLRSPNVIRPWQFVLDVLRGYLFLGMMLEEHTGNAEITYNFGPAQDGFQTVDQVASRLAVHFVNARYVYQQNHDCNQTEILRLDSSKARQELGWIPIYSLEETLEQTASFHKALQQRPAAELCLDQTKHYLACVRSRT